jgi:hypothetical protein
LKKDGARWRFRIRVNIGAGLRVKASTRMTTA